MRPPPILVLGCTPFGHHLALALEARGCRVIVIDSDAERLDRLPPALRARAVHGNALECVADPAIPVPSALAVVMTSASDESNVALALAALRARGARRALARIEDPARVRGYAALDIETIDATTLLVSYTMGQLLPFTTQGAGASQAGPESR